MFAADILRFADAIDGVSLGSRHIMAQLIRSATSVGANAEEAMAAYSRRDFACKNAIALREARESRYWLRLLSTRRIAPDSTLTPLLTESNELIAILTAVVKRARDNAATAEGGEGRREKGRR
jgi:four helix bundle protein